MTNNNNETKQRQVQLSKPMTSLQQSFLLLKDTRRRQGRMHTIDIVLMIVVMGTISGCFGYRALGDFIKREKELLITFLQPRNNKLPSFVTIFRIMTHIDEKQFIEIFEKWVKSFHALLQDEIIAIDGKALQGTKETNEDKKLAHIVSFFAIKNKQTIALAKTSAKSNEIPLVQSMLQSLQQAGLIYTMDAMHTQKETLKQIIDNHCNYIVGVKSNQKKITATN